MTETLATAPVNPRVGAARRVAAWSIGPLAVLGMHLALSDASAVARMLAFIGVLFLWMKAVVALEYLAAGGPPLSPTRWLAWTLLWPGMRPQRMLKRTYGGGAVFLARGLACVGAGVLLVAGARCVWLDTGNRWFATVPLLAGLSLVLHYGLFNVVTAGWRLAGVDVRPLFRSPLQSASLRDFWMRRWNIAFSEMCQESVVRVTRPLGPRVGAAAVFLFSGLLHEVAISLPVRGGYGLPTLYFAIHGVAVLAEPRLLREGGVASRVWTALLVVAPLPLVFHEPFLAGVVWPIIGMTPWTS